MQAAHAALEDEGDYVLVHKDGQLHKLNCRRGEDATPFAIRLSTKPLIVDAEEPGHSRVTGITFLVLGTANRNAPDSPYVQCWTR